MSVTIVLLMLFTAAIAFIGVRAAIGAWRQQRWLTAGFLLTLTLEVLFLIWWTQNSDSGSGQVNLDVPWLVANLLPWMLLSLAPLVLGIMAKLMSARRAR